MDRSKITGVIMAGGKSTRMGMDKGSVLLGNKYLVQYSINVLKSFCSKLIISTQNEWYAQLGYPLVKDLIEDCGPIGGIYSSLLAAETPYIVALACDMPFISSQILEKLIANIHEYDCVVPRIGDKYEPLCAVYSKKLIPGMERHIHAGQYALHNLIEESNHFFLNLNDDATAFMNLNTMNDLDKGKQLL